MASWFGGLAQEWTEQVNRAAASAQRLAEQAELPQLGERIRASTASAFGFLPTDEGAIGAEVTEEELSRCFVAEACALKDAAPTGGLSCPGHPSVPLPSGGPTLVEIEVTLRRWAARLEAPRADGGPHALHALLSCRALNIALMALARSKAGRQTLRTAAGGAEEAQGAGLGKSEAPRHLRMILDHASAVPPVLLQRLLGLLAEVAKAATKGRKAGRTEQEAEQDLQWILTLLSAALVEASEVAVRDVNSRAEAIDDALAKVSAASTGGGLAAAGTAGTAAPVEGAEVWAEWTGDGRWYRAQIKSAVPSRNEVEVEWLSPPVDVECGRSAEYVASVLGEAALAGNAVKNFAELPLTAIASVEQERPAPIPPGGEESWVQQLDAAEALSHSFLDLKAFCEEFTALRERPPIGGEAASKALAATARSLEALRAECGPPLAQPSASTASVANEGAKSPEVVPEESSELGAARQELQQLRTRGAEIANEHKALLDRLKALEKEQAANAAAILQAEKRVKTLGGSVGGDEVARRGSFLAEAGAISVEVEALLARRTESAATASRALADRLPGAAAGALRAECMRRRRFEDLILGLHAALWGPDAAELTRDPAALASIRDLIKRTGSLLEQAWREMVQLAAETLGDGGALRACSEEMSQAAKRYKEMRKELQGNLDRLNKLEASVGSLPPAGPVPPQRAGSRIRESALPPGGPPAFAPQPRPAPSKVAFPAEGSTVPTRAKGGDNAMTVPIPAVPVAVERPAAQEHPKPTKPKDETALAASPTKPQVAEGPAVEMPTTAVEEALPTTTSSEPPVASGVTTEERSMPVEAGEEAAKLGSFAKLTASEDLGTEEPRVPAGDETTEPSSPTKPAAPEGFTPTKLSVPAGTEDESAKPSNPIAPAAVEGPTAEEPPMSAGTEDGAANLGSPDVPAAEEGSTSQEPKMFASAEDEVTKPGSPVKPAMAEGLMAEAEPPMPAENQDEATMLSSLKADELSRSTAAPCKEPAAMAATSPAEPAVLEVSAAEEPPRPPEGGDNVLKAVSPPECATPGELQADSPSKP